MFKDGLKVCLGIDEKVCLGNDQIAFFDNLKYLGKFLKMCLGIVDQVGTKII